uniref:Uncharacterized protein n=1 Tax=Siphoviridae sp. ctCIv11 TaxID=2827806 RepID=A0A8S5S2F7_9CAUD|nr:MAG TPA: hypothetical protein [Siphoviridae sp. ctCIv11]
MVMALPCHGRITWVQAPYDSLEILDFIFFKALCKGYEKYNIGVSPSGKAQEFDSCIRRFKSYYLS